MCSVQLLGADIDVKVVISVALRVQCSVIVILAFVTFVIINIKKRINNKSVPQISQFQFGRVASWLAT